MKIIPLKNGSWISAESGSVLFPAPSKSPAIPDGVPVFEIHRDAAADINRENLFRLLGVKSYSTRDICDAIIRSHMDTEFKTNGVPVPELISKLSLSQLISHVQFLMVARWSSTATSRADLLFVAEDGSYHQGSKLYLNSEQAYSANNLFRDLPSEPSIVLPSQNYPVQFVHKQYESVLSASVQCWTDWLCQNLGLAVIPRLVKQHSPGSTFALAEDFEFIIKNKPTSITLTLLREHWGHYKKWIVVDKDRESQSKVDVNSANQIQHYLSCMEVSCQNGSREPLGETILPSRDVLLALGFVQGDMLRNRSQPGVQSSILPQSKYTPNLQAHHDQEHSSHLRVPGKDSTVLNFHSESTQKADLGIDPPTKESQLSKEHRSRDRHRRSDRHKDQDDQNKQINNERHKLVGRHRSHQGHEEQRRHRDRDRNGSRGRHKTKESHKNRDRQNHDRRQYHKSRNHQEHQEGQQKRLGKQHKETESTPYIKDTNGREFGKHSSELFLEVPDPDNNKWEFLKHLGVIIQMSADMFVERLKQLKGTSTTTKVVDLLYEKIERSVREFGEGTLLLAFSHTH